MSISAQYLLEGAFYALEQCGRLLHDARLLYKEGSYSTALALTELAQEELGKSTILREVRKEVINGAQFTIEEIKERCKGHSDKQVAAAGSTTMRPSNNSSLAAALQIRGTANPGTEEWNSASRLIDEATKAKTKRDPEDRHRNRITATYVDPIPAGWSRPSKEISRAKARDRICDASNEYAGEYRWLTDIDVGIKHDDPELYAAVIAWTERPMLPDPDLSTLPGPL
jgi:AbiV family abortive infection protein